MTAKDNRCPDGLKGGFIAGFKRIGSTDVEEIAICDASSQAGQLSAGVVREKLESAFNEGPDFRLEDRGACTSSSQGLPALLISASQVL